MEHTYISHMFMEPEKLARRRDVLETIDFNEGCIAFDEGLAAKYDDIKAKYEKTIVATVLDVERLMSESEVLEERTALEKIFHALKVMLKESITQTYRQTPLTIKEARAKQAHMEQMLDDAQLKLNQIKTKITELRTRSSRLNAENDVAMEQLFEHLLLPDEKISN